MQLFLLFCHIFRVKCDTCVKFPARCYKTPRCVATNSTETQLANLNAISGIAYVPPYRPDFATRPMAFVASIHRVGDKVKAFKPASFLNPSNSRGLNPDYEGCAFSLPYLYLLQSYTLFLIPPNLLIFLHTLFVLFAKLHLFSYIVCKRLKMLSLQGNIFY